MWRRKLYSAQGIGGLVWIALVLAGFPTRAQALRITPGSRYWPLLEKLETRRSDLVELEDACQQLRDIEETVSLAEEVAEPMLPGLEQAANSQVFAALTDVPYIGSAAKCVRLCLNTVHAGLKALAWVHELDAQMIKPLTDAVLASNAVLRSRDDRDVSQVIFSYRAALVCLQRGGNNLSASVMQAQNMLRLTNQVLKLVRRYKPDDTDLISALMQYQDALNKLLLSLKFTQVKIRGAIAFVEDVLSAVPREPAASPPVAGHTETAQVEDRQDSGLEASATQRTPASPVPTAETELTMPLEPQPASPPAGRSVQPTRAPSAGSGDATRDKVVFAGGVMALGTGLGALAYVVAQVLGSAGLPFRKP